MSVSKLFSPNYKYIILFSILIILFICFTIFDLFFGTVRIPIKNILEIIFTDNNVKQEWTIIVNEFRIPKTITAILAGVALSVSGLQMQTVFKNPLAGPDVLGISSGASLGVAIVLMSFSSIFAFDFTGLMGNSVIIISSWLGSALILLLVFSVSVRIKDIMTILVLGILFGSVATSAVGIMQYFSTESMLKSFVIWTMGSLGGVTKSQLYVLTPCIAAGLIIALLCSKILNALLLGENYGKTMGLNIKLSRLLIFLSTSILAGSITAFCGPIGFIGIAVPHLTRMILKTSLHNYLILGSCLIGAIVMLISDIISQLPGNSITLPINSVTALLGIPIIAFIIIKNYKFSSSS